ncbi:MAG: MFS transporter [Microbacterium sp.]|uniref:MFS transporter n=1 Tax=Microbacterium sp. TaxID=51671 RepID=UPI0008D9CCBA|nr:MFS transporter [Microbacterium sp.]MAY50125.1 MFS transporter [Microbacterium sp.]HAM11864.1 MFS transporter [Microbacterium sp.]
MITRGARARSPWLTLVALCLGFFLMLLDSTIVAVAIPAISREMSAPAAATVWVNSGYLFAYAVPLLFAGRWGDRIGARRVYLIGLVLFVAASAACGLSATLPALTLARVAQGLGAALMTPQTLAIIRRVFPAATMPVALGVWGSVGGLAAAAGPLLGGLLVGLAGWPSIFLVNVPLGAVAFALALMWVPSSPRSGATIPVAPVALGALGVLAVIVAVHEAASAPVFLTVPVAVVGAALVVLAIRIQPHDPRRALVPARLLQSRGFVRATLGATGASFVVGSALIPVMLELQDDRGLSVAQATLAILPLGVVSAASAPFAGTSVARWGPRPVALVGVTALAVSTCATAASVQLGAPVWTTAAAMGLFGLANSFVWSPLATAAMTAIEPEFAGAASGAYNATRQLGAVLGSATVAAVIATAGTAASLWVLGATAALSLVVVTGLPRRASAPSGAVSASPFRR